MNTFEAIKSRHSYRGEFKNIKVPREDLRKIIEAGMAAPSGCNKQTTYFIGIDDENVLNEIKKVIDLPNAEKATSAICVLTKRVIAYRDRCYSVNDYSAAIENMLLMIVELGYQSCWYEGHITDTDGINHKMEKILNVPNDYEIVCYLPIGVAKDEVKAPLKRSFEQRASFNNFDITNS